MGVYIHNMEMPKNCGICPFCVPEADEDRGDICVLCGQFPLVKDEKSCECPLIPVTPHGRLIDADELLQSHSVSDGIYFPDAYIPATAIKAAPTIIPAEEGE